jgi:hypothetical protein
MSPLLKRNSVPILSGYTGVIHFVHYNAEIKVSVNPNDLMAAAKEALK